MKKQTLALIPILLLASSNVASAFDQKTIEATRICHDHIWNIEEFKSLPNAAISAFPGIFDDNGSYVIFWNVYWDDPNMRRAGNCLVKDEEVLNFEDYVKDNQG